MQIFGIPLSKLSDFLWGLCISLTMIGSHLKCHTLIHYYYHHHLHLLLQYSSSLVLFFLCLWLANSIFQFSNVYGCWDPVPCFGCWWQSHWQNVDWEAPKDLFFSWYFSCQLLFPPLLIWIYVVIIASIWWKNHQRC